MFSVSSEQGFDKGMCDRLANHPYFVMIEKAIMDYMSTIEFEVVDIKNGDDVEFAKGFLRETKSAGNISVYCKTDDTRPY